MDGGGGDIGGLDQEKVAAAGEALFEVLLLLAAGREGIIVDEVAEAGALAHGSPPSISVPLVAFWFPPRTRASKSVSPFPFVAATPFEPPRLPKLIKSFRGVETLVALFAPSSCSFRVCSFSTRDESDFMSVMYA